MQAYKCLNRAVTRGVTYFDELNAYFKDNYDVLAPYFLETKKPAGGLTVANQEEILNLHNAFVNEIQQGFMAALAKDRMYKRPCGSVTDQQIWLVGVLVKYFVNTVLRFNHRDFMHAIRQDLGPILGETGLWALKNYQVRQADKGNEEKKRMARTASDLVTKYLESGFDNIGKETKYNLANRFGPKKCPDKAILKADVPIVYSWAHYAPQAWYE